MWNGYQQFVSVPQNRLEYGNNFLLFTLCLRSGIAYDRFILGHDHPLSFDTAHALQLFNLTRETITFLTLSPPNVAKVQLLAPVCPSTNLSVLINAEPLTFS
jgi:hypothetical protein